MKRLALSVIVMLGIAVPMAFAAAGPPDTWTARPPIHVRGNASTAPTGYTPAQIRHAYGVDQLAQSGAGQVIGIVDAYDDPTVASDLQAFITTFGLPGMHGLAAVDPCTVAGGPHPCFQKVYAQGTKPRTDGGWALEISLDAQWSHVVAPGADILLVEAATNSFSNLLGAVDAAVAGGAAVVSMSWGGGEFSTEANFDGHFDRPGVSFVASSGDSGTGTIYPAVSPFVVAVGGTTLELNAAGTISSETAWNGSGGGISKYETEPSYQSAYPIPFTGGKRGVPDVAYDADPQTGFPVYDSTKYQGQTGWFEVGGTSAGSPQWAALIVLADQGRTTGGLSTNLSLSPLYSAAQGSVYAANYHDITAGSNGTCGSLCTAGPGYDFVTGLGSPTAASLVPYLTSH